MRAVGFFVALFSVVLTAQLPLVLPTGSAPHIVATPALSDLEQRDVEISRLNAQLVDLQEQLDVANREAAQYRAAYNRVQLQLDRVKRTPPDREGHVWSWELKDGRPVGYVKDDDTEKR